MKQLDEPPPSPNSYPAVRAHAFALLLGSIASVLLMLRHPSVHSHRIADVLEELRRLSFGNGLVHGSLLVAMLVVFLGFLGLADRLGWRDPRVRSALLAQGAGFACMLFAALINGFVIARIAASYAAVPAEELTALEPTMVALHAANQTAAQAGTIALSLSILAWSLALFPRPGAARWIGLAGLLAGGLPIAGLLAGLLALDVHGMGLVVLAEAAWNVAVAVWLLRTRE